MEQGARALHPVERLAEVIPLFPQPRSCFTCVHARFPVSEDDGAERTYCSAFGQGVDDETHDAEDCGNYEFCEDGSQPIEEDL